MNAEATARRVLQWAADPAAAALPAGPLRSATALSAPATATVAALAALVRRAGARAGAGSPPFGDRSAVGPGAILLAAAIGGRAQPRLARVLAEAVPPSKLGTSGWADALARHAVLEPALPQLGNQPGDEPAEPLAETLLRCSPLSALLCRPPATALASGATAAEVATARGLMTRPHGIDVLQAALSAYRADAAVLSWRAELLTRLAVEDPVFVADIYVAARLRHGEHWDAAVRGAHRAMSGRTAPDDLSIATLRFWLPLSRLRRRHPNLLRARPLMRGHDAVLHIVEGRHRLSIAGAS
jgi:FtsH ternary system domain X1